MLTARLCRDGTCQVVIVRQGADVEPILFANGDQVPLHTISFGELSFPYGHKVSEKISELAISSAMRDTEMLHEMGLVSSVGHYEEAESKVVIEFLKYAHHPGLEQHRRPVLCSPWSICPSRSGSLDRVCGARRVACEEALRDDVDWDIYQIAAGLSSPAVLFAAAVCAAIQIGAPVCRSGALGFD